MANTTTDNNTIRVKITKIKWDTDGASYKSCGLPRSIDEARIEFDPDYDDLDDTISDWLSDNYGICHNGFCYEVLDS